MTQPPTEPNAGNANTGQPNDQGASIAEPASPSKNNNQVSRLLNSRPTMFLMLFCVTGFLGIPFLVKSQAFSRSEKVIWSIVVTIYTCVLLWLTGAVLWWSYSRIRDAFATKPTLIGQAAMTDQAAVPDQAAVTDQAAVIDHTTKMRQAWVAES